MTFIISLQFLLNRMHVNYFQTNINILLVIRLCGRRMVLCAIFSDCRRHLNRRPRTAAVIQLLDILQSLIMSVRLTISVSHGSAFMVQCYMQNWQKATNPEVVSWIIFFSLLYISNCRQPLIIKRQCKTLLYYLLSATSWIVWRTVETFWIEDQELYVVAERYIVAGYGDRPRVYRLCRLLIKRWKWQSTYDLRLRYGVMVGVVVLSIRLGLSTAHVFQYCSDGEEDDYH